MFFYDPLTKDKLPYWDSFPLVFPIDFWTSKSSGNSGFIGVNLHYLPPDLRVKLYDALVKVKNNKALTETTRIKMSYQILKKNSETNPLFLPCIKKYIWGHVRSRFYNITPNEWNLTILLPLARFNRQSPVRVWADSRKRIKKGR